MQETLTAARYTHDCSHCRFLGQHGTFDLYFCGAERGNTVIARHASDGPAYTSGMSFSYGCVEELTEARRRAQRQGLLAYDLAEALYATQPDASADVRAELEQALEGSDLGHAFRLLLQDAEAGAKALRDWVQERTQSHQTKHPGVDHDVLESYARRPVMDAYDWLGRLGRGQPRWDLLMRALYLHD